MSALQVMYRDVDRTPYLFVLREYARKLGLDVKVLRKVKSPQDRRDGRRVG